MSLLAVKDVKSFPKQTQTAGTVIRQLVPYVKKCKTAISYVQYVAGATAHTLTVLKPYGKTTLAAAIAANGTAAVFASDPGVGTTPGAMASADKIVIEQSDGTLFYTTINGAPSGMNVTLAAGVTVACNSGANVWFYGVVADGHPAISLTASATTEFKNEVLLAADKREEPVIVESDNATNAGTLYALTASYLDTGNQSH